MEYLKKKMILGCTCVLYQENGTNHQISSKDIHLFYSPTNPNFTYHLKTENEEDTDHGCICWCERGVRHINVVDMKMEDVKEFVYGKTGNILANVPAKLNDEASRLSLLC
jgi:hypothetical protein